ncbi:hypothetical protein ACQF4J_44375 [Streptomyces sp. C1-1]|uniref:hypothetical protein n=1 Tax=Streptomyces sp. C1-1 TaxID=3231173 RepID=UPI003CFE5B7B
MPGRDVHGHLGTEQQAERGGYPVIFGSRRFLGAASAHEAATSQTAIPCASSGVVTEAGHARDRGQEAAF